MFVYCGDCENGKIRVLDTDDGVVEEVDKIQLKVLQSQGYAITKDFSYDYAYDLLTFIKNRARKSIPSVVVPDYMESKILSKVSHLHYNFGVRFNPSSVRNAVCSMMCYKDSVYIFAVYVGVNSINSLVINDFGVFSHELNYEFKTDYLIINDKWFSNKSECYIFRVEIGSFGKRLFLYVNNRGVIEISEEVR